MKLNEIIILNQLLVQSFIFHHYALSSPKYYEPEWKKKNFVKRSPCLFSNKKKTRLDSTRLDSVDNKNLFSIFYTSNSYILFYTLQHKQIFIL